MINKFTRRHCTLKLNTFLKKIIYYNYYKLSIIYFIHLNYYVLINYVKNLTETLLSKSYINNYLNI